MARQVTLLDGDTGQKLSSLEVLAGAAVSGPVESVFGRTGAVVAVAGDYAASEVDNDSTVTGATVKDALDWLKANAGGAAVGLFANRPAAGSNGRQYFATDGVIGQWVDDGSAWRPLIAGVLGYEVPDLATFNGDWTPYNAGGISVAAASGGLKMTGVTDAAIHNRGWAFTVPSVGDVSIEVGLQDMSEGLGGVNRLTIWGCGLRSSATEQAFVMSAVTNHDPGGTSGFIDYSVWTDDDTRASFVQPRFGGNGNGNAGPIFIRARRTGGNFIAEVSLDRQTWIEVSNTAASFTADQVIIATDVFNGPAIPQFMLLSLLVETP